MTKANECLIAPSILAADLARLGAEIHSVVDGGADWLHVDVMDGAFVPPITFGANAVSAARASCSLPLDVHLMVERPELRIGEFKSAGTDILTVHQEACPHLHRTLQTIRQAGMQAGVALNPGSPADSILEVLELCDLVLVMTVNPGWGGQQFIASCIKKIELLANAAARRGLSTRLEVDGGITAVTAEQCRSAGAAVLVAGSYIFTNPDRAAAIRSLR